MFANYRDTSKTLATSTLKKVIIKGVPVLALSMEENKKMDMKLRLQVAAYLQEYTERGLVKNDKELMDFSEVMFGLFGPCWGVKDGECRE